MSGATGELEGRAAGAEAGLSAYSPGRPLVLLTEPPPDAGGGGAVILRSLLGPADRERLLWLSPTPGRRPPGPGEVLLREGSAGRGRRSGLADSLRYAGALADEVLEAARARGAAALWVVLHGAAVPIGARLVRRSPLPVHVTVHDDPPFAVALRSRRQLALVPLIARDFAAALRGAASIDVISEPMADRYRRRYGVGSTVVHRALGGPIRPAPPYDRERHGLRVAILGVSYDPRQLDVLAAAVGLASRRLGVPGRLSVMGGYGDAARLVARLRAAGGGGLEIELTGHLDEPEAVERLRECFLLAANYPFGRRGAVLRQTSFPTKLSTYVQAARPLLLHAPADSSVSPLLDPPGYAIRWGSLRPEDGAALLERCWSGPGLEDGAAAAASAERARRRFYDPDRNRRALLGALNRLAGGPAGPDRTSSCR